MDNLPQGLHSQRQTLTQCLQAMAGVMPLRAVYLFGSYARGDARPESDVDLCIVAEGADRQLEAARKFRRSLEEIWPCPSFTLLPISPQRLAEKRARNDHFFSTVLKEGVLLASQD
jgi:predicted nucleotidyltransferase